MYQQPLLITGQNASDVCFGALKLFTENDPRNWHQTAPRGMTVRERIAVTYRVDNVLACIPWMAKRRLNYSFMAAEFCWICFGRDDVASISRFCPNIAQFSDDGERFFGAYGPPFVRQLPYIVETLNADSHSRQAVGVIWRERPPKTRDVPCTVASQFLIRNSELHGIFTMRSSDAWLGLPYDLFNFSRLTAVVAGRLQMPPGSLTVNVGSAHLYDRDRERAEEVVRADDARPSVCNLLPAASTLCTDAINAALDGRATVWPEQDVGHEGWQDIFNVLQYAKHRNAEKLSGDFQTVIEWDLEARASTEPGISHPRPE